MVIILLLNPFEYTYSKLPCGRLGFIYAQPAMHNDSWWCIIWLVGYSGSDMANLCREAALGPIRTMAFEDIEHISADQVWQWNRHEGVSEPIIMAFSFPPLIGSTNQNARLWGCPSTSEGQCVAEGSGFISRLEQTIWELWTLMLFLCLHLFLCVSCFCLCLLLFRLEEYDLDEIKVLLNLILDYSSIDVCFSNWMHLSWVQGIKIDIGHA